MNILMLVSNGVTRDPRVLREAVTLREAGHAVDILGWDRTSSQEQEGTVNGIPYRLVRTPAPRLPDSLRLRAYWKALRKVVARSDADVIHAHDLDTLPGCRSARAPVVYDSHEDFPALMRSELGPVIGHQFARLERNLSTNVTATIAANPAIGRQLAQQGFPEPTLVLNAKEPWTGPRAEPEPNQALEALYIGGLTAKRGIEHIMAAATPKVHVTVAGYGKPRYESRIRKMDQSLDHAQFIGTLPATQVLERTAAAHVVLAPMDPKHPNNRIGTPNKFYEALATGRPLVTTKGTDLGDEVERLGMGLAAPHSAGGYRDALRRLDSESWREMSAAADAALQDGRDWATQQTRLLSLYDRLN